MISDKLYTSVIIGPNGTGKSNLLKVIIELFREIYLLKDGIKRPVSVKGRLSLVYRLGGNKYEYTNIIRSKGKRKKGFSLEGVYRRPFLKINGEREDIENAQIPEGIIANSIMLTDKFPVLRNKEEEEKFPIYHYLGVRNRPQQASTRSYIRKTVEFIVKNMNRQDFKNSLNQVSNFLNLSDAITIQYRTINTPSFFWGKLTPENFKGFFYAIEEKYKERSTTPPFKLHYFQNIENDRLLIESICSYCNNLVNRNLFTSIRKSSSKLIRFNLLDDDDYQLLQRDYEMLEHLRNLGMISTPDIKLNKRRDKEEYNLSDSSSGEYHFFSSMIGIIATIKPNSLILIDEPEVSLHPNWQMQYLTFLRAFVDEERYSTCHIIIATHSHFLISDLKGDSSKIIGLQKHKDKIVNVDLNEGLNTFGWSAEEVLYKIFSVKSTRNYYIEYDLVDMVNIVNRDTKEWARLETILKKLQSLKLSNSDPLKILIEKATKYYQNKDD